jgi:hypothetical protein
MLKIFAVDRPAIRKLKSVEWTNDEERFPKSLIRLDEFDPEKLVLECK